MTNQDKSPGYVETEVAKQPCLFQTYAGEGNIDFCELPAGHDNGIHEPKPDRECPSCDGQGLIGDYVGFEMRCVGIECDRCLGTGRVAK